MKILFLTEYFPTSDICDVRGGVEARCFFIARELAKHHDVTVIASREHGTDRQSTFSGIKVIRCGLQRHYSQGGSIFGRLSFILDTYLTARSINCDVIDSQIFIPHLAAMMLKKPCFITYHSVWLGRWVENLGFAGRIWELLEKRILKHRWKAFIAVSESTKKELERTGIPGEKIHVVRNGVEPEKSDAKIIPEKNRIICVSRLVRYKRVDTLLRAVAMVSEKMPVTCHIIGTGPEEKRLKDLAAKLGIEKKVFFHGFTKGRCDVISEIKKSKVLCLPSVFEGFGMALLEAMACGVPYVCTDMDVLRETTHDSRGGLMFEPGSHAELSSRICELLNNPALYIRLQAEGLSLAKEYKWKYIAKELEKIYKGG